MPPEGVLAMRDARKRELRVRAVAVLTTLLVLLTGLPGFSQQSSSGDGAAPSAGSRGQVPSSGGAPGQSSPALGDYVLGPGDVLDVSVWGYPDLTREVIVGPDGKITLPLVGPISAAGIAVEKLRSTITQVYQAYVIHPQVIVVIKAFRKIHAATLGQVTHPGPYDLQPGARLIDLIAAAGGLTDAAALKEARLLRPGQAPETVDLARVLAGDPRVNVPLKGGEMLVIPEDLANLVNINGQVVRPGRYRLKGETHVLDALLEAGGLTPNASITQAKLVRASGESEPLDLDALLLYQNMGSNVVLRPGDSIFIPEETNNKIYVVGDVKNPGVFLLKGNVTMLQAIAMAGGPDLRGAGTATTAYIVRRGGGETPAPIYASVGKTEVLPSGGTLITADLGAIMRDPGRDVTVQPGDVLVVPQTGLSGLQFIVSILSGIASIFRGPW